MPGWHLFSVANYSHKQFLEDFSVKSAAAILAVMLFSSSAMAVDAASTTKALRLANTITGGLMPTSDPIFAQMVAQVALGNMQAAATLAANSTYFSKYLARRLALQMQNPALDASASIDSDPTTFIVAHFVGAQGTTAGTTVKPQISTIWSDNSTYLVNVTVNGVVTPTHTASLTAAQLAAVNWTTDIVQTAGQTAKAITVSGKTTTATPVTIAPTDVGGYLTLSDRPNDTSYAQYGALAGTNLRMIEGMWEIATGLQLLDVASTEASATAAPRFIPEYNANFFVGQGQTACLACHGGGFSSINHGYAAVADTFDYTTANGLAYIATPTTATMKSLGSDPTLRTINSACNLVTNPTAVCNPDSTGVGTAKAWDLNATWAATGVLTKMGWTGSTTGNGLNSLGANLGKANIVYQNLTTRIIGEICPMGMFTQSDVNTIAAAANPFNTTPGTDDVRTIVALVAANQTCQ